MRSVVYSFFIILIAGYVWYSNPEQINHFQNKIDQLSQSYFYSRDLIIKGAHLLKEDRIVKSLPASMSNFWWRLNPEQVVSELVLNPIVEQVELKPCRSISLSCFELIIKERKAGLLAVLADNVWLLGTDGGYMVPFNLKEHSEEVALVSQKLNFPIVEGLDEGRVAPELVRSRAMYVYDAVNTISKTLNLKVAQVVFESNGELKIKFQRYNFQVVFEASFEDPEKLKLELDRLTKLMVEIKGQEPAIKQIDLAYSQAAVVTLTEAAMQASQKLAAKK